MIFKRSGKLLFGVQLNSKEQKILEEEIKKHVLAYDKKYQMDDDSAILYMLHTHFGFGPKKLKRAWQLMYQASIDLRKYYEMGPTDSGWLSRRELKKIGCDIEQWYEEEQREDHTAGQ